MRVEDCAVLDRYDALIEGGVVVALHSAVIVAMGVAVIVVIDLVVMMEMRRAPEI